MLTKTYTLTTLLTTVTLCASTIFAQPSQAQQISFACAVDTDKVPTTYAQTPDDTVPVFKWTSNYFRPPYTPMQRCQEVAGRMNNFYANGMMDYLTSGVVNNQPVICAGPSCNADGSNVLITLKPNQDPNQVLQEIDSNRSGAGGPSYQLTGGTTSSSKSNALTRNSNGTVSLDMNRFLQTNSATVPQTSQPTQTTSPGILKPNPSNSNNPPRRTW
ncbi:COP23 domain-containing protein [Gloeothece verrucosa]|uniref:Circadian oscillating protein COP23 n=1 Tax=Gloeothece verrucosa (strain PCC 7822) TaxID=497965 RepID=E0U9M2_GLOV7|nr:COP23 domain-containing protein [Gloeothece verrucosa]ADN13823.1 conserved hypothetical protein [Gloeothece verrucosa PCC 7822]